MAVTNIPDYSSASVAEHVFAFVLELARNLDRHAYSVSKGRWCRHPDFCYWVDPLVELVQDTVGRHDSFALACTMSYLPWIISTDARAGSRRGDA